MNYQRIIVLLCGAIAIAISNFGYGKDGQVATTKSKAAPVSKKRAAPVAAPKAPKAAPSKSETDMVPNISDPPTPAPPKPKNTMMIPNIPDPARPQGKK